MKLLQSWWLFWFLVRAVVVRSESDCANGEIASDGSCHVFGDYAGNKAVDDMSEDMRVELLQRDLRLSNRRSELAVDEVNVKPWTCAAGTSEAYQSTTADDNSWTKIKVMNLISGEYGEVLDVDLNKFSSEKGKGKIRSLNACAINDADDILYCAVVIYDKGTFLMAIDQENNMGFVNKLLGFRYAATFYKGDYYVSGEAGFSVVRGVKDLKKFATFTNLHNANLQHEGEYPLTLDGVSSTEFGLGADFALWKSSNSDVYLAAVKDKDLKLIQLAKDGNPVAPTSVKTISTDLEMGPGGTRCWGAAWNFKGGLYIAADDGKGFYQLNTLDLANGKAFFEKKGEANEIDWNDGFTCGTTLNEPSIKKITCEHDFYQVATFVGKGQPWTHQPEVKKTSETFIRHLNLTTGKFETDIQVDRSKFPQMTSLNACAVHPNEGVLYCFMEEENRDPQSIISLDEDSQIVLVTEHKKGPKNGKNLCFAAVFDKDANFWYWCADKTLYKASGLEKKKGVWSHDDLGFQDDEGITAYPTHYTDDKVGADFVLWEEKEDKKTYLVSIVKSVDSKVSVIDISDPNDPKEPMIFESSGLEATKSGKEITWGSAWTAPDDGKHAGDYAGKHFFTPDTSEKQEHNKLYQLTDLDFEAKKAHFKDAGEADKATWHDGFTCLKKSIKGVDDGKTIKVG
mmetsp:Transcript_91811/g.182403  ORF Transcript_91811/g.182403 Transcript_91811/m.182403 type:complete len:682 (+) Transcript_91811:65-2110(+)